MARTIHALCKTYPALSPLDFHPDSGMTTGEFDWLMAVFEEGMAMEAEARQRRRHGA